MTAPNMATITASLERSLRNCSLNHAPAPSAAVAGISRSNSSSDGPDLDLARFQPCHLDLSSSSSSETATTTTLLDLNSHVSLPYQWEQCLDLQTGEIYYKNWRNGMKAKEDPRLVTTSGYSTEEEEEEEEEEEDEDEEEEKEDDEEEEEDEEESYESSEGSSTSPPQPPPPPSNLYRGMVQMRRRPHQLHPEDVLVVAGCKSCLMYYMVPKQVLDCPKCTGQLIHFDRPDREIN